MKTLYTVIEPIPPHIPRQLAIDLLQSHGEIITLNPLVLEYHPIKAPRDAPNDEYYSTWYEILERIQFMPGIGKMGSSKITFRGCFHDMPWGVQTHMYVPFNIDLRHKYQIKGNQPGEPPEPREIGSNAPAEGLYMRIDVQIKCNITMLSFVKKELNAASKTMIDRMIKKAELIDAGVLQTMFDDAGKVRTHNPNDRSRPQDPTSPLPPFTPSPYAVNSDANLNANAGRSPSMHAQSSLYPRPPSHSYPSARDPGLAIEMPGDMQYGQSSHLHPNSRQSVYSELGGSLPSAHNGRWSAVQSDGQSSAGGSVHSYPTAYSAPNSRSPRPDAPPARSFVAELPSNEAVPPRPPKESQELSQDKNKSLQGYTHHTYNPQHYAGLQEER